MRIDSAHVPRRRPGFTLIEMLVVLGIILMLAVLTVLFMPRIQERQKVAKGAELLQGWLKMAKMQALRDRVATGVRLQPPPNSNFARDLQYIQKPDDYSPTGRLTSWAPVAPPPNCVCTFGPGVNLFGSAGADVGDETSLVQSGDYLQLRSEGLLHQIIEVRGTQCTLASPLLPLDILLPPGGASFRIIRQPRLLAGEQPLQLPQDVAIDLSPDHSINVPLRRVSNNPLPYWEILFAPSGAVVGQGTGNSPIILWLRDVTLDVNKPGDQTLIAIYPRTGLIAGHPVGPDSDHYQFAKDGRSSGL